MLGVSSGTARMKPCVEDKKDLEIRKLIIMTKGTIVSFSKWQKILFKAAQEDEPLKLSQVVLLVARGKKS